MTALRSITVFAACALLLTMTARADATSAFVAVHPSHTKVAAAHVTQPHPEFEWRLALGCGAVAMLVLSRLHEPRYPQFFYMSVVAAAICCWYGFASGAWPLGIGVGAYGIRILTMRPKKHIRRVYDNLEFPTRPRFQWHEPHRLERLFGTERN